MRKIKWLVFTLVLLAGCQLSDENPDWNPKELPAWAYDAPWYYRPTEDLPVAETIGPDIPVYYTSNEAIFVPHPNEHQVPGVPRIAVWHSVDQGRRWERDGYFGAEQTHYRLLAERDGPHWIRFVGPGQPATDVPKGQPQRIYVLDRRAPHIRVNVSPSPWKDKKKRQPNIYRPGQTVRVSWRVMDANLDIESIKLGLAHARFPHNLVFAEIPEALDVAGSMLIELPAEAAVEGGVMFRVKAKDKAKNVGVGTTDVMRVAGSYRSTMPGEACCGSAAASPATPCEKHKPKPAPGPSAKATAPPTEAVAMTVTPADPNPPPAMDWAPASSQDPDPAPVQNQPTQAQPTEMVTAMVTNPEPPVRSPAGPATPVIRPQEPQPSPPQVGVHKLEPVRLVQPSKSAPQKPKPFDLVHQQQGTKSFRPGWPRSGAFLRGATFRRLGWIPAIAVSYDKIELQFSANDGRPWQTVQDEIKFSAGCCPCWIVPMITSKNCRLRYVGIGKTGERVLLARSPRFTVHTVMQGTTFGPKTLGAKE